MSFHQNQPLEEVQEDWSWSLVWQIYEPAAPYYPQFPPYQQVPEETVKHKSVSCVSCVSLLAWIPGQGCRICFCVGAINRTDTFGRIIRKTMVARENQWVRRMVFCSGEVKFAICEQKNSQYLYFLILCFRASQYKSNETPTWCNTVQVLFLQGDSTCFGRKRPSSGVFKN
jgi:hypothetical protein